MVLEYLWLPGKHISAVMATLSPYQRMSRLRTVAPWPDIAGLRIFALRGMVVEADRESLLSGLHAVVQAGRRNINGSKADIA